MFIDKPTGFKAHGWSVGSAASEWYKEQLRRGKNPTVEECKNEVIDYTCQE